MGNTPELEVLVESARLSKDSVIAYQAIVAQRQLQALLGENKQLREVAYHLVGYVCHCNLSKCECGHDYVIDMYEDMCGRIQPNKDAHHE